MKMKHSTQNILFFINDILLILYLSRLSGNAQTTVQGTVPLVIASFMMTDVTYLSACNLRANKVLTLFCGLLILDCWYLLLLPDAGTAAQFIFMALSPLIWYLSIKFILMFLFQGSGYKFRKSTNALLLIACAAAIAGIGLSKQIYALLYAAQFLTSWLCLAFVLLYHRKRAVFVLKSERKSILLSAAVTVAAFLVYYFATARIPYHISNFGVYLPVLLFCISVHGIVHKEHQRHPLSVLFRPGQTLFLFGVFLTVIVLRSLCMGNTLSELCIAVNLLFAFIELCSTLLEHNLKNGRSSLIRQSRYSAVLQQLQKEEQLKTDFANFLHDDILQDILSVKNMLTKAHRPEVQELLAETLDHLNASIREQMQDYHPVILKNLTIRENYQHLLDAVSQSFPQRNVIVTFECADTLFLVEPYNIFVYRLLKELLTNIYKHSDGSHAWITLSFGNNPTQNTDTESNLITLRVADDGTASAARLTSADTARHKGIFSITEQVHSLGGTITLSDNAPHGICIQICIPMKGEFSYEYFVNR